MPLTFDRLRQPKPAETVISWDGEELHVTYDRAAFTVDLVESTYSTPIRQRLTQVLLGWDLLKDGAPWQPDERNSHLWSERVYELRILRAVAEKGEPLTDDERQAQRTPPATADERLAAYRTAWDAILVQLPREFIRAVDGGILDDFLGGNWRGVVSANGVAPMADSGAGRGGTT